MKQYYSETKFKNLKQDSGFSFEDIIFYKCKLENIEAMGADLNESLFIDCELNQVIWYWARAWGIKFINCTFKNCDLRGSFDRTLFLKCTFENCKTGDDNLGGKTEWDGTQVVDCKLIKTELPVVNPPEEI